MVTIVTTTHTTSRKPIPENSGSPAIAWPTPMVNGLRNAPGEAGAGAGERDGAGQQVVVAEAPRQHHQRRAGTASVSSAMPMVPPPSEKSTTSSGITTSPRPPHAVDQAADPRLERAGRLDDAEGAADEEDVEDDRRRRLEPARLGEQHLERPGGVALDVAVGVGVDEATPALLAALVLARGDDPGDRRRQRR